MDDDTLRQLQEGEARLAGPGQQKRGWDGRIYPHWGLMWCKRCCQRFSYEMLRGGRTPEYCPTCRVEVKGEQARRRMAAMRRRRRSA